MSVLWSWTSRSGRSIWTQSVFIVAEHRGTGLLELLDHLAGAASAAGALDLRLYAHRDNERALRGYERCGFTMAPYVILRRDGHEPLHRIDSQRA